MPRLLAGSPYTQKVREEGRIVNVSVLVASALNTEGKREVLGMDVGTQSRTALSGWPSCAHWWPEG